MQEGLFLNRFASKITVIHRRDELRAGAYLQQRVFNEPKFEFLWDSVATEVVGEQGVQQLRLKNLKTGEESTLDVEGVFIFVGHEPNTEIFAGKLDSDERGYILADAHMRTSVPGIFVAGEAQDSHFRQAITTAGDGAKAAMEAIEYVERLEEVAPAVSETTSV